jgi:hypothetical protein
VVLKGKYWIGDSVEKQANDALELAQSPVRRPQAQNLVTAPLPVKIA